MDAKEAVVVYGTNGVHEAEILRNELRAAGIACELESESQGGFTELVEARLLVRARDVDRALRLIERRTIDKFEPPVDEQIPGGS